MVLIALSKKRLDTRKKKNSSPFWRNFSANHSPAHSNLCHERKKSFHSWHERVDSSLVDTVNQNSFAFSFYWLSVYSEQHDFLSLQQQYGVVSRLCARFSYSDCQRSRPGNNMKISRNSIGSLGLVAVSKSRPFVQPPSAFSNYPQTEKDYENVEWSTFRCRRAKHGQKWVSGVRFGRYWVSVAGFRLQDGCGL